MLLDVLGVGGLGMIKSQNLRLMDTGCGCSNFRPLAGMLAGGCGMMHRTRSTGTWCLKRPADVQGPLRYHRICVIITDM